MQYSRSSVALTIFVALLGFPLTGLAQDDETVVVEIEDQEDDEDEQGHDEAEVFRPGEVEVIGERPEDLASVPGSAATISQQDLENQTPVSGNEVLRNLAGVHVRDEEGMGLRPNIGIRGLNPSRGRTLLVLEDGVPIALAPYGEPELYYAPAIERMERLELVKGSGSVLFGPQTIGGVLNYITPQPPEDFTVSGDLRGGNFGYLHGKASVGDTVGDFGYWLSVMHQRFEGPRALNLDFTDVTGRVRYQLSDASDIGLKLHAYDEFSNATYLGLTTPQFEENHRDNFASQDELPVRRLGASMVYNHLFGDNVLFRTTAYGHYNSRNWNRQDFDRRDEGRDYRRIIDGSGSDITDSDTRPEDGSAVYFRDTMGARNRSFYVAGVEPRATIDYALGSVDNELTVGTRVHTEIAQEQRVITSLSDPDDQFVRDDETRTGFAVAAYGQNRFLLMDERLQLSPGLRVENFWSERRIDRTRVEGDPTDLDPPRQNSDHVLALIPGMGVSFAVADELTVFAGAHRGFSPPRTKDAVTSDGDLLELDAEFSINYELGLRAGLQDWAACQLTGFVLDFSNQIIPPSEAGGATATDPGQLVNAGETLQYGVEADFTVDAAAAAQLGFNLPLTLAYTWVHAEFGEAWRDDIVGNRIPYAPEHQLSGNLRFQHPLGLSAQVNGLFVSEQFTDLDNTVEASQDGLVGRIDSYFLIDARVGYTHQPWGTTFYVAGKNLSDEKYISSRAPRGIQPGVPRQVFGGVKGTFQ